MTSVSPNWYPDKEILEALWAWRTWSQNWWLSSAFHCTALRPIGPTRQGGSWLLVNNRSSNCLRVTEMPSYPRRQLWNWWESRVARHWVGSGYCVSSSHYWTAQCSLHIQSGWNGRRNQITWHLPRSALTSLLPTNTNNFNSSSQPRIYTTWRLYHWLPHLAL